jgi:hypothetical protein
MHKWLLSMLLTLLVGGLGAGEAEAPAPAPAANRWQVPEDTLWTKALHKLKLAHQDDYAKRGAEDRRELARTLLKEGLAQTTAAEKFVALREAVELAAQVGEADLACAALDEVAKAFVVDGLAQKGLVLDRIAKATTLSAEQAGQLGACYLALGDEAGGLCQREQAVALLAKGKAALQKKLAKDDAHCREIGARIDRRLAFYQKLLALKAAPWDNEWQHEGELMDYHSFWAKVDHNGRSNVWQSCPIGGNTPFRWKRTVKLTAGKSAFLHVEVASTDLIWERPMREFFFVAAVNGKELVKELIIGSPWHSFDFPLDEYAGQEVNLELRNQGPREGENKWPPLSYWDNIHVIEVP